MTKQRRHQRKTLRNAFASVSFRGTGSAGAQLTGPMMRDLVAYCELVRAIAADLWREEHDGKSLPPRFHQDFRYAVTNLGIGSTECDLVRDQRPKQGRRRGPPQPSLEIDDDYFTRAQDRALESLSHGTSLDQYDPIAIRHLRPLGETSSEWGEDSVLEIRGRGKSEPVRIPLAMRRVLSKIEPIPIETHVTLVGQVVSVDKERSRFAIRTMTGRRFDGVFPADLAAKVVAANAAADALVHVAGRLVRREHSEPELKAQSMTPYQAAHPEVTTKYVTNRFAELKGLAAGWYDGKGQRINHSLLRAAHSALYRLLDEHGLDPPRIYPNEDGGLSMEWSFLAASCVVTYEMEGPTVYANGFGHSTREGPSFTGAPGDIEGVVRTVLATARGTG